MADVIVAALMSLRLCAREQSEDFEPPFKQKISGLNPLSVLSPLSFSLSFFLKKEDVCGSQTTFRRLFFFSRLFRRQKSLFCLLTTSLWEKKALPIYFIISRVSLFFYFLAAGRPIIYYIRMPFFLFLRGRTKEGDIFGRRPHKKKGCPKKEKHKSKNKKPISLARFVRSRSDRIV